MKTDFTDKRIVDRLSVKIELTVEDVGRLLEEGSLSNFNGMSSRDEQVRIYLVKDIKRVDKQ